jgi:hypothetical protein
MRKKTALIVLVILALGLVGASLSALYEHDERFGTILGGTFKASYGFPLGWHGYSTTYGGPIRLFPSTPPPVDYWFSLESFLLDIAFWSAISSLAVIATMFYKTKAFKKLSVINI